MPVQMAAKHAKCASTKGIADGYMMSSWSSTRAPLAAGAPEPPVISPRSLVRLLCNPRTYRTAHVRARQHAGEAANTRYCCKRLDTIGVGRGRVGTAAAV